VSADRTPRVSFLLAVHNDARFIAATLRSILDQTFDDFELVVVDDASTDGTADLLQSSEDRRVRYFRNDTNLGQVPSLNVGLKLCRGELVARIDGDDLCEPTRLAAQVKYLADHPDIAGCATWTTEIDENDNVIGALEPCEDPAHVRWSLCHTNRLYHPSMALRRAVLEKAGGYDTAYPATEDYELWTRLIIGGARLGIVPQRLIRYRRRAGSITATHAERQRRVGCTIATRYTNELTGRSWDESTVGLMRTFMSWQEIDLTSVTREQVQAVTALMAAVRRAALTGASPAARAAADAEVADRLGRRARGLLGDAPGAAARLGSYITRLPGHRRKGLEIMTTAARCTIGRWRRGRWS
jgi:GT2 family glycosyltransferase